MWGKRVAACAFILGSSLVASSARAQSDEDRAGARAAATEGVRALDEGRYADAVDLFTRAESLVHAPPHLLYMARAYTKLGKLVRAREVYLKITRETWPASAPKAFLQAHAAATSELAELEARIPTVTIDVTGSSDPVLVTVDDASLPKALVGVAHPIDPGTHVFWARAKGMASEKVERKIAERGSETVSLPLKPSPDGLTGDEAAPPSETKVQQVDVENPRTSPLRPLAWVALGVGVVGGVAGTYFLLKNHSARSDADALCGPDGRCPTSARARIEGFDRDADDAATASWIGYGVGAAGLAAGAVLFIVSGRDSSVKPVVGLGTIGVSGRF